MKLEIYNEKRPPREEPVRVAMADDGSGDISIRVVGDAGEYVAALLWICRDGTILLNKSTQSTLELERLGFRLSDCAVLTR